MQSHGFFRRKFFIVLAVLVGLLLLAIILVIIFSEPLVRSLAESQSSKRLGRELVIEDDLDIRWHWTHTSVHVEKLRLANAQGYPDPDMVNVETLDFTFKPLKLLIGKLEFGDIVIDKPYVILEKKSIEEANWHFPVLSSANLATETVEPDNRHEFPLIQTLELREGKFIFRDHPEKLMLDLALDTVIGQGGEQNSSGDEKRNFTVSGTGSIQDNNFEIQASGASLEMLRDSTKDYPLTLKIVMGSTKVNVDGKFRDPINLTGVDTSLNISGNNMADLFYLTAIPLPPSPPYSLEGQLTRKDKVWNYKDFKGKVGSSDLSGNLTYDTSKEKGFLKANLTSQLLDSQDLGGFIGLSPSGAEASLEQQEASAKKEASPTLIPDVPLSVERLRATNLDVSLKADKIEAPNLPFKGMDVRFDLRDGILKLDPLKVVLADGSIDGAIEIDAQQDVPPMKANLNLRNMSLAQFFANTRFSKTTEGFFGGQVALSGQGASLADVLASSDGEFAIMMTGGKISLLLMEAADLDIGEALPLLLGHDKSTPIHCAVLDFTVADGLLTSDVILLDTKDSLLVGNMTINLENEVINAKLDAKPKDTSIASLRIPLVVSGRLKEPDVGLDSKKTLTRGATAVAIGTLLTPFAAILPFIEKGDAKDANCRALIEKAKVHPN